MTIRSRLHTILGVATLTLAGVFMVSVVAQPPATTANSPTRNPYAQPFASSSIWNMPIGSSAQYASAFLTQPTIRTLTADQGVVVQDPTAPATAIKQNGGQHSNTCVGSGTLTTDPIPAALTLPSSAHNNEFTVLKADGQTIDEGGAFSRCVAGGPAAASHLASYGTLYGDGLTGGAGGSHLSTLGGLLRPGEISPTSQGAPHALRLNINGEADLFRGTAATCYRWPATRCDGYGPSRYGGHNPSLKMGALLAIPQGTSLPALNLQSQAGAELAWTLQNYGAYVANDAARSVFTITTEQGDANTVAQFQKDWGFPFETPDASGSSPWAHDLKTIIGFLSVVDNNGPSSIGGGGTPLQPLAPPLSSGSCLTAAHVAAATPTAAFDPDGDGDDDFVDPPTASPSPSDTPSPTPTATPTPTDTPSPSPTPTATPTATPCPTPTPTGTPTAPPTGTPTPTSTPTPTPTPTPVTGAPHVMVVILENKGYAATLGTCSADPYFCSLAAQYESFTNSHGVSHPSLPNYLAFVSGSTQGCTSDGCATGITAPDLGGQLSNAGVPWIAYMESMPSACYTGATSGSYARKHNPFVYFTDNSPRCHDVPYPGASGLVSALDGANPSSFVWITPNLINDMHDGTVQQGDAWLKANLPGVLNSAWFAANGTVIVTMDEGDAGSTNQVPTVVISANAQGKGANATLINHYALLRAIESTYGLGLLGAAATAPDITGAFG